MKKVFLLALSLTTAMSCKTAVTPGITPDEANAELIALSVGSISRAGNEGVRDILFATGDQIGVIGVNPDDQATPTKPQWPDTCFDNRPALWLENSPTESPTFSHFVWGPAGEGGIMHNQYYPGSKKKLYIYAYYPYSGTNYVKPTDTPSADGPKLKVALSDGAIAGTDDDVNKKQADVLYYISGNPAPPSTTPTTFSSESKMVSMTFQHALAQLRFVLKRPAGAAAGKFVKLVFKTAKNATMDIATGAFTYDGSATYKDASYTITPKEGDAVDIPEDDGSVTPFVGLDILKNTPLMIFPLSLDNAKLGELVLTVDFSKTVGSPDTKDITVDLGNLKDALVAGSLNTYTLSVNYHVIELKASITAWDTANGSNNDLDAE